MITEITPIERYIYDGKEIFVKRDDLFSGGEAPSLAKLRGLKKVVEKYEQQGVKTIAILDTRISKAGWGLAYLCKDKKMDVICFYPKLKDAVLSDIQLMEQKLGAKTFGLKPNYINVLYYKAVKELKLIDKNAVMLPFGLILNETKEEVSKIIDTEFNKFKTLVVAVGTGTICSGILDGIKKNNLNMKVYGVTCGMSLNKIRKQMKNLLNFEPENLTLIKPICDYYDKCEIETPFPSSVYYDKKAFKWMIKNYEKLEKPILFWNIGV